ncbi:MAG: 50S ribosomal protein L24 [Candidatus Diapherotrites archaeon]
MKSSKPRKQRKALYTRTVHKKQNDLAGHLSKELRKELKQRSIPLRKEDKVKIMRGSHKAREGKIIDVNYTKGFVYIEKVIRKKADGTEVPVPVRASNVMVVGLYRDDDRRIKRKTLKKVTKSEKKDKKEKAYDKKAYTKVKEEKSEKKEDNKAKAKVK